MDPANYWPGNKHSPRQVPAWQQTTGKLVLVPFADGQRAEMKWAVKGTTTQTLKRKIGTKGMSSINPSATTKPFRTRGDPCKTDIIRFFKFIIRLSFFSPNKPPTSIMKKRERNIPFKRISVAVLV